MRHEQYYEHQICEREYYEEEYNEEDERCIYEKRWWDSSYYEDARWM